MRKKYYLIFLIEIPSIIVDASNVTVSVGEKAVLKFLAEGEPQVKYQWYKDGSELPASIGGQKNDLELDKAVTGDTSEYYCKASNEAGNVTSKTVTLRVVDPDTVVTLTVKVTNKDSKENCNKFFPEEFQKSITRIMKSKISITDVKSEDNLCNITVCSKNPCKNGGTCQLVKQNNYQCVCSPSWTGKQCEKDLNECKVDSGICYENGVCENLEGSFKCNCSAHLKGLRCEYKRDACSNNLCDKSTERCVPSTSQRNYSCIKKKTEVTLVVNQGDLSKQKLLELEDLLNRIIKSQSPPTNNYNKHRYYRAVDEQAIDFSQCKPHITPDKSQTRNQSTIKIALDCLSDDGNRTLQDLLTPSTIKVFCKKLLSSGLASILQCGQDENMEKPQQPKVDPSIVEVKIVVEDGKGKTRKGNEVLSELESKLKENTELGPHIEIVSTTMVEPSKKETKDNKTVIIIVVCLGIVLIAIVAAAVYVKNRKHSTAKHSLIMEQRSVMSHGKGSVYRNGEAKENMAYNVDEVDDKKSFMFEMPTGLKSPK